MAQQGRVYFAYPRSSGYFHFSSSVPAARARRSSSRLEYTLNSQHSTSSNRRGRPCVRSIRRRTHPSHKRRACRSLSSPRHCRKQASSTKSKLRRCWLSVVAAVSGASLSALLDEGNRAVTVRVDEARGVAGLAHPGESPYGDVFCQRVLQHSNSFAS